MLKRSLVIGLVSLALISAVAAVPTKMNFQGRLTDAGGNPITIAIDVKFSIFDATSGGSELWTETINLTPDQGLVNQELGLTVPIAPTIFSGDTRYLAVKVGADSEMAPRIPLATVPFAFRAAVADTVSSGQVVTSLASSGATALRDAVTLSGGSGISLVQAGQNIQITAVSTAGGTVTQVNTGTGLTGGPITASGTISIANGGVAAGQLATSAVTAGAIADDTITEQKINMMNGPTNNYTLTYTATGLAWGSPGGTGTVTQVNTTSPITGGPINTTGTIAINQAGIAQDGYLSSVDWNTFNNKLGSADLSGYIKLGPLTQQSTTAAYGINVKTTNASGVGISGEATANGAVGVYGLSSYNNVSGSGHTGYGVYGMSNSYGGHGVHGVALAGDGADNRGVYGYANGNQGWGVVGVSSNGPSGGLGGNFYGVRGSYDASNYGMMGGSGTGTEGHGTTYGAYGSGGTYGVYGTGTNYGGYFHNNNAAGYAVGTWQQDANGYSMYMLGGRNYIQGNTGIGTDNPQALLHVQGNLKVTGTIEGASPVKIKDQLDINGGVKVGSNIYGAQTGLIEFDGANFRGYNGVSWVNFGAGSLPDLSGYVQLGPTTGQTTTAAYAIQVKTTNASGVGISGETTASSGYGVYGANSSATGGTGGYFKGGTRPAIGRFSIGVFGITSTGNYYGELGREAPTALDNSADSGVYGYTSTLTGHGVYGLADATTGAGNNGGYFEADGDTGTGVYGYGKSSAAGKNFGVYGRTDSANGYGVYGSATSDGFGVYGYVNAMAMNSIALCGETAGPDGYALVTRNGPVSFETASLDINGTHYTWPSANPGSSAVLTNDGAGALSWVPGGGPMSGYVELGPTTQQSTTAAYAISVKTTNASGVAISAETTSASGAAVFGMRTVNTKGYLARGYYGAYGQGSNSWGALADTNLDHGVVGYYGATTYGILGNGQDNLGVEGHCNDANGVAVYANQENVSGYSVYALGGRNYFQGNTGIGTNNPQAKLQVQGNVKVVGTIVGISVETDSRDGAAIMARNNSTSGASDIGMAIIGKTSLADTYGVLGYEDSGLPEYAGIYAKAVDTDSSAIYARSSSPASYAGRFLSENAFAAIWAQNDSVSAGRQYGIYVQTPRSEDYAVAAYAEATSGVGVYANAGTRTGILANSQYGAYGSNGTLSYGYLGGVNRGAAGMNFSSTGMGVYGSATHETGANYGGYFSSASSNGTGVYGINSSTTGITKGGAFQVSSSNGFAVYGSNSTIGTSWGYIGGSGTAVYGITDVATGSAVYGYSSSSSGVNYAGYFNNVGSTGYGIFAQGSKYAAFMQGRVKMFGLAPAGAGTVLVLTSSQEVVPQSSSRRYKKEIVDYQVDSAKFNSLRPVRFKWNDVSATPNQPDFGLIAEEVEKVYPELVALNQNGSPESVAYDKIGVILIKVLQEKNKEIEALKVRLKALEDKIK